MLIVKLNKITSDQLVGNRQITLRAVHGILTVPQRAEVILSCASSRGDAFDVLRQRVGDTDRAKI